MKPTTFNSSTFTILYKKYKRFIIPSGIVGACLIIFIIFLIPQIQDIFTLKDERVALIQQIAQLKVNKRAIQGIDDATVSQQLDISSAALPPDKDFAGVLNAISAAAQSANVVLGDYGFDVGTINTKSAKSSQLSLQLQVSITGDASDMQRFLTALSQRLPISDVESIQISQQQAQATLDFFYRPFPDLTFDPQAPITVVNSKDEQTIATLQQWRDASIPVAAVDVPVDTSTPTPSPIISPQEEVIPSISVSSPSAQPTQ